MWGEVCRCELGRFGGSALNLTFPHTVAVRRRVEGRGRSCPDPDGSWRRSWRPIKTWTLARESWGTAGGERHASVSGRDLETQPNLTCPRAVAVRHGVEGRGK